MQRQKKERKTLESVCDAIREQLEEISTYAEKLQVKGVKSASTKVRKAFQEIKVKCKEGRDLAQEIRESL